ncbi:MAG TPA: HAMP domain-containing sensor histidine kinase [Actinomycetota bacterium]|nr:HAMP domain-containing sensor histidine kinase [Actinomycetota bacterium]
MTRHQARPGLVGLGLAPRLLLNNLLVILAGAGTVLVTALLIAPAVFQYHLLSLSPLPDDQVLQHVARAFDQAILVALGGGILIAGVTAGAISWLVAQRLATTVSDAAGATSSIADGRLDTRVADPRMGPEFARLASAVNQLADRLQATEATRRTLTADLAHQLRTPIASIGATVEAVRDGVLPADEQTLETLGEQSQRLRRLVDDLEVVSRAEERQLLLEPAPIVVADLLDAAVAAHRESYRAAGVHLTASVTTDTPPVTVDPDRIHEVLGNLLDNALRHTPPGGTVAVTARLNKDRARPAAVIEIADSGTGFPTQDAERIFGRFEKHGGSPGSGLGLTIARAIIEAHHGSLIASSDGPGTGARFTVRIPAATKS